MNNRQLIILYSERQRWQGAALRASVRQRISKSDLVLEKAGENAQLERYFRAVPYPPSVAAITRQFDAGDAALFAWVRADPCHLRPDLNGVRMLATADMLQLTMEDAHQLLPALKPVAGDMGFLLDVPVPERWYIQLQKNTQLPQFSSPESALGDDIFDYLPDGAASARWRAFQTEVEIILHQHPWNAQRVARGLLPINSLWCWGGGVLPNHIETQMKHVVSNDVYLTSLASLAGTTTSSVLEEAIHQESTLIDFRHLRDFDDLEDSMQHFIDLLSAHAFEKLVFDFSDGACYHVNNSQRWRIWRKSAQTLL